VACTIIAECCQNHNGDREILKRMVHAAAEAGADFAKIQGLRSNELTHRERFERGLVDADGTVRVISRPFEAERTRLERLDLTDEDEAWFVQECRRAGIRSMITAFTRGSTQRFVAAGFDAVKVASYDCRSVPLLREVAAGFDEVYLSTGASYDEEIAQAATVFRPGQMAMLHCVTIYPTPLDQLHLRRMEWLRSFSSRVGFSDHTKPTETGLRASLLALAEGAEVLERHFTVLEPSATRDGPVSVDPTQLAELRSFADLDAAARRERIAKEWPEWEVGLGMAQRDLSHAELLNRDYYGGRVAAWVDGRQVPNDQ
jgi:sialic acid synthase SpsE